MLYATTTISRDFKTAVADMVDDINGDHIHLEGTARAVRCAEHIAHENFVDARWALEVLNKYGHLVPHGADWLDRVPERSPPVTMAEAIRTGQPKLAATPEPERSQIRRLWTTGRVREAFEQLEKLP